MNITQLQKIFLTLLILLILVLSYYQIIKGDYYYSLSEKYRIKVIPLISRRGNILDRNGNVLATYKQVIDIVVNPQELKDKEITFKRLSEILELPYEELLKKYKENFTSPFVPVTIAENVSLEKVFLLEENRPELNGIDIEIKPVRFYPLGQIGAHILGYLGEISSEEFSRLKHYGYRIKNTVGKMGIEKALDVYLRGEDGGRQVEVDNLGNVIQLVGEKKPVPGKDIQLTINKDWQEKAHHLLGKYVGAIIMMDVRNGEILVMESSPSFDPNIFATKEKDRIKETFFSSKAVLLNRATKANIPPGSIFKLVMAIAGLSSKKIDIYTRYRCEGKFYWGNKEFNCWLEEGHGDETVVEAIKHSCNIFFYRLGLELGIEKIRQFALLLGLGEKTGIEIEEDKGFIPSPKWKQAKLKEKWYEGDTLNLSIGQGYIMVTPIQILRLISMIANGGFLIKPHLIKGIDRIPVEEVVKEYTGISENILKIVKEGMFKAVNEQDGTGIKARVEGLEIAAKTATIQTSRGFSHALIAGFLPYSKPKLGFLVFLEHGGKGGGKAAELCQELFSSLKKEILEYP